MAGLILETKLQMMQNRVFDEYFSITLRNAACASFDIESASSKMISLGLAEEEENIVFDPAKSVDSTSAQKDHFQKHTFDGVSDSADSAIIRRVQLQNHLLEIVA